MNVSRALGSDLAKVLILSLVMSSLFLSLVLASDIESTFECRNTNGETTFYSYLKSPGLDESNYTDGLKTGTLNYYKGTNAYLYDKLNYYDGFGPTENSANNASVKHTLKVEFSGDKDTSKGVSQFYAKGFYTDNRVVSASKKFWFNNQTSYPTNNISVTTTAKMSIKTGSYDLKYEASGSNAYFVFNDVTGHSNRTGARRIDWEQEGLLKGEEINVTNDLKSTGVFIPRAGAGGDWLPCTCLGPSDLASDLRISPPDELWPSIEALAVLSPANLMYQRPDCSKGASCREVKNWRNAGSILYLDTPSGIMEDLQTLTTPLVQAESSWERNVVDKAIADYTIKVSNLGSFAANNVVLMLKLSDNLTYIGESATIDDVPQEPYRPYHNASLFWNIGDLGSFEVKTVKLQAKIGGGADPDRSIASVTYKGGPTTTTGSAGFANVPQVEVESFYTAVTKQLADYRINVRNLGTVDVGNVTLVDTLIDGMVYQEGATIDSIDGITGKPEISNEGHTLTWNLGTLLAVTGPDGRRTIKFSVKMTNTTDPKENIAYVKYQIGTTEMNTLKVESKRASTKDGNN